MKKRPIILKNIRVHNLQGVDLELQSHELIVFTGVSGSGKSSLAFDTLYVEGQRRYIESLSLFARRYLGDLSKPDVEYVSGLSPTIAIEQKSAGKNPRSTVGTLTEIYDYLRVLFARVGVPHCPISGEVVSSQSKERITKTIQSLPEKTKLILLAPFVKGKKGEFKEDFQLFLKKGYTRARVNGVVVDLSEEISLDKNLSHTIEIVIDRVTVHPENDSRIAEGIALALEMGHGMLLTYDPDTNEQTLYSTLAYSPKSGLSYSSLEPHDFSFNSPSGMCPRCSGLGYTQEFDLDKMIDPSKSIAEDCCIICPACHGARLQPYPAATTLGGKKIDEICSMNIAQTLQFFQKLNLEGVEQLIAEELLKEIKNRLVFLVDVGLHYLSLDRIAPTLSGGEAQRVRLASQVGCGLVGITYILDEPSIGLHPRDNHRLIETLKHLRDVGNTVIVVEHDEETIREADRIVDFGPGPGKQGGRILVNGTIKDLFSNTESMTGSYLSGKKTIPIPQRRRKPSKEAIVIEGATHNNLKNVDVHFPLGLMIAVTGVSGSGKSSLITDTLYPALANSLHHAEHAVGSHQEISGIEKIDKVIAIDQTPIGRTPRSNPATYIKIFDEIRDLFSQLPESVAKGYRPGRFSFNVRDGACPQCHGIGMIRIDMDFMEDQWVDCQSCQSQRFDHETLSIHYKGKNIHHILEMSVEEAREFFSQIPALKRKLDVLCQVGLEYIALGQPSTTLSGGEAQRIKLAKELVRPGTGKTFYILDEPTTGLHFHDIQALLNVLQELVSRGNTVLVIEHNMDVVKTADWVIDLGPEGGGEGGKIIAQGPPEKLAKNKSPTGTALQHALCPQIHSSSKILKQKGQEIEAIEIEGAEQNNLKHLDLAIPRGKLTICTGPSGSGKSSLAFETVYAEGQRRYIESLTPYARQFVKQMAKPKVSQIEGLSPAIAIEQKATAGNPRSTVGTMTEIYDYLRLLYAQAGTAYCPETGEEIKAITKDYVVEKILSYSQDERVTILAPLNLQKNEKFEELTTKLSRQGYLRIRLNGQIYELDETIPYDRKRKNEIDLVIDRLKVSGDHRSRLYESVEHGSTMGNGKLILMREGKEDRLFNLSFAVESTGKSYPPITPHTFSFNSSEGMCLDCQGLGYQFLDEITCASCKGSRLQPLARAVRIGPYGIADLCRLPIIQTHDFIQDLTLPPNQSKILEEVLKQLRGRLNFLIKVGLDYLSLDRTAPTLSNGEAQRIRLARQLGGELTGVLYVLDEPTIGLHPHDNERLNQALASLKELGNTLLMVEHDPQTLATADYIFDFGPGAGTQGGHITAKGTYPEILINPHSLTGAYLSGKKRVPLPKIRRKINQTFRIENVSHHNIKNLTFELPLGIMTCLIGVSGSGKSTLMHQIIRPAFTPLLSQEEPFNQIIVIDQDPIGQTVRSDVGTYADVLPTLREFYANLGSSRTRGLLPRHFSYNHRKGMCTACWGLGYRKIEMLFLPAVKVVCDQCRGMRLNPVSLEVVYEGKNFGQLLEMTVEEARSLFEILPRAKRIFDTLISVGLGYLRLGQEMASLSGGEAQRMKLSRELSRRGSGKTLYLLDEPTTGLHPDDIKKLLAVLHRLVDKGNTMVIIEHNVDMIRNADYLIDMGPGGGENGGKIVCTGTPEEVSKFHNSLISKYL